MFNISKLPFLLAICIAIIKALSDLYNGKSFDIMARETCIVIIVAFIFGSLIKYAVRALLKDVLRKRIEEINEQQKIKKKNSQARNETESIERTSS